MTMQSKREILHDYLESADDKKVDELYALLGDEIVRTIAYSEDLKQELDNRFDAYKKGNANELTEPESKKRIQDILNSAHK